MEMFAWLGDSLMLLRRLRGKSQAEVARQAGIGESQLSRYESGRELPKLDSLEKVLDSLGVTCLEFSCTLAILQTRARRLAEGDQGGEDLAWLLIDHGPFTRSTEEVFGRVLADLLKLHAMVVQAALLKMPADKGATRPARKGREAGGIGMRRALAQGLKKRRERNTDGATEPGRPAT
jgi:transcriptional regulator with XRE-family HTH domain